MCFWYLSGSGITRIMIKITAWNVQILTYNVKKHTKRIRIDRYVFSWNCVTVIHTILTESCKRERMNIQIPLQQNKQKKYSGRNHYYFIHRIIPIMRVIKSCTVIPRLIFSMLFKSNNWWNVCRQPNVSCKLIVMCLIHANIKVVLPLIF